MTDTFRNLEHTKTAQWFSSTLLVVTNQKSHSTNFDATLVHDPWDPSLFCSLFSILRLQFVKLIQKRGFYEWYHIKSSSLAKSGIESWECTTSNTCFFRLSPDREEEDSIPLWIKQNWFRISIDEAMTPQKSLIPSHFQTLRLLNSKIVNGWSCNELHGTNTWNRVNPSTLEDNCGSDLLRTSTWPQLKKTTPCHNVFNMKPTQRSRNGVTSHGHFWLPELIVSWTEKPPLRSCVCRQAWDSIASLNLIPFPTALFTYFTSIRVDLELVSVD